MLFLFQKNCVIKVNPLGLGLISLIAFDSLGQGLLLCIIRVVASILLQTHLGEIHPHEVSCLAWMERDAHLVEPFTAIFIGSTQA